MKTYYCLWIESIYVGTFSTKERAEQYCASIGLHQNKVVEIRPTPLCEPTNSLERHRFFQQLNNPNW